MKKKSNRKFLLYFSILILLFNSTFLFSNEDYDFLFKGPMAGGVYYTKKNLADGKKLHLPIFLSLKKKQIF